MEKRRRDLENEKSQELFLNNDYDLLVATKAFGMVSTNRISAISFILTIQSSIESYYQEVGRAGRDGNWLLRELFI